MIGRKGFVGSPIFWIILALIALAVFGGSQLLAFVNPYYEVEDKTVAIGTQSWQVHTERNYLNRDPGSVCCDYTISQVLVEDTGNGYRFQATSQASYEPNIPTQIIVTSPTLPVKSSYVFKIKDVSLSGGVGDTDPHHGQTSRQQLIVQAVSSSAQEVTIHEEARVVTQFSSNQPPISVPNMDLEVVKDTGDLWDVFIKRCGTCQKEYLRTISISNIQRFRVKSDVSIDSSVGHLATAKINFYIQPDAFGQVVSDPPVPESPKGFSSWIASIFDWIKDFFSRFLAISGPSVLTLPGGGAAAGDPLTYNVELTAPYSIDEDFGDGTYSVRYCTVGMVDSKGNVIDSDESVRCTDSYSTSWTTNTPNKIGEYLVVALMTENNATYNTATNLWEWQGEQVLMREAFNVQTGAPLPSDVPASQGFLSFIAGLWNALLDLFRGIFG